MYQYTKHISREGLRQRPRLAAQIPRRDSAFAVAEPRQGAQCLRRVLVASGGSHTNRPALPLACSNTRLHARRSPIGLATAPFPRRIKPTTPPEVLRKPYALTAAAGQSVVLSQQFSNAERRVPRLVFSFTRLQVCGEEETSRGEQPRRSTRTGLTHPPRSSSPAAPGESVRGTR